jgi:hypothetical protein
LQLKKNAGSQKQHIVEAEKECRVTKAMKEAHTIQTKENEK